MAVLAPISGLPRFRNGRLVSDAVAYFYDAGTTTPRTVYQDAAGSPHANPVDVLGDGNFPAIYVQGSTAYKIRIEDGDGVLLIEYDELQGEVATSGGGGGGGTTIPTGAEMVMFDTGAVSGWVRENGRTIGSASSGATERANADTEALFLHLWAKDASLALSGGARGGSAAADWAANRAIALPDMRGRVFVGLDDVGSTAASRLTGGTFAAGNATTLGSTGGEAAHALTEAENGAHSHGGATGADGNHNHGGSTGGASAGNFPNTVSATADSGSQNSYWFGTSSDNHTHAIANSGTHTHAISSSGSGTAHNTLPPFGLRSIYIKL